MSPPITFFTPGNTNKIKALEGKKTTSYTNKFSVIHTIKM